MKNKKKIAAIAIASVAVLAFVGFGIYNAVTTVDFGQIVIDEIPEKSENATRIMSFNVRCASDPEGSINNRSQIVTAILQQYAPDSFGVQEATPKWLRIIDKALGDKYARVGEPRDKYGPYTEYSCVYYLKDKFELVDSGTIWLSETPDERYSKSFDSACARIATWAVLKNKLTGKTYTHMNTHLDHVLESTRVEQSKVLLTKLAELQANGNVICTGDFNTDNTGGVYAEMLKVLDDTSLIAKTTEEGTTYHNYGKITDKPAIDFIFASKGIKAETYKIIKNTVQDMYPSDHYPLCADVII